MIREIPASIVRQNLNELLNEIRYHRRDSIVITKSGKPVAALVDIALFEKIQLLDREFERLITDLARAYSNVDEITALAEIEEVIDEVRHEVGDNK